MVKLRKRIKNICILSIIILSVISVFSSGEEELPEMRAASATNKKIVYEIYTNEDDVILAEKNGEEKSVIKKGKAVPMRKNDYDMLIDGIETASLEEALMMFEDFTS